MKYLQFLDVLADKIYNSHPWRRDSRNIALYTYSSIDMPMLCGFSTFTVPHQYFADLGANFFVQRTIPGYIVTQVFEGVDSCKLCTIYGVWCRLRNCHVKQLWSHGELSIIYSYDSSWTIINEDVPPAEVEVFLWHRNDDVEYRFIPLDFEMQRGSRRCWRAFVSAIIDFKRFCHVTIVEDLNDHTTMKDLDDR